MNSLLEPFQHAIIGKPVSLVWQGYGSALFIEFGRLTASTKRRRDGSLCRPDGEITLMIEWSWRIEKPRSILGGSWSSERRWPGLFRKLTGASVTHLNTFGALPEIEVSLSNGLRVVSFMTAEGQPEWGLISRSNPKAVLGVKRGRLQLEQVGRVSEA